MNEQNVHSTIRIFVGDTEIPFVLGNTPRNYFNGKGLAVLATIAGGDDLRHYCEYLKAHSYFGDAFKDAHKCADDEARVRWAINTYRKFVKDDVELAAYMRIPAVCLAPFDMHYIQTAQEVNRKYEAECADDEHTIERFMGVFGQLASERQQELLEKASLLAQSNPPESDKVTG